MPSLRPLSVLLFAVVAWADARVHDWLGCAFWAVATVVFGLFSFGHGRGVVRGRRWVAVTWTVLGLMAAAVAVIRLGLGYTG